MPKFSVVIPIYNTIQWIDRCLESIRIQTFTDFEALLVDDGSTDGSVAVCKKYAEIDKRFRLVCGTHAGPAAARNLGIRNAKGDYILFVDSDDEVEQNYFNNLQDAIGSDHPDICYVTRHFVVEKDKMKEYAVLQNVDEGELYTSQQFLEICVAQHRGIPSSSCIIIFQRKFGQQNNIYMDESMEWSEDADFSYHLFSKSDTIKVCNKPAYFWHRDNGETLSNRMTFERLSARMNHYIKWSKYYADSHNFPKQYDKKALLGFSEWLRGEYCNYLHMPGIMRDRNIEIKMLHKLKADKAFWEKSNRSDIVIYRKCGLRIGCYYNKLKRWKGKLLGIFKKG